MTGLRHYERDLSLLALAGEEDQAPPTPESALLRVRALLAGPFEYAVTAARLDHARWKPTVAMTATYVVTLEDGSERFVTWKRYRGEKADHIRTWFEPDEHEVACAAPLAPFAPDPESGAFWFVFPTDRVLRDAGRIFDMKRTLRVFRALPEYAGRDLRWRRTRLEVLRYKPERRAVMAVHLVERLGERNRTKHRAMLRMLPVEHAARAVANRLACFGIDDPSVPRFFGHDPESGAIIEEWVDLESFPPSAAVDDAHQERAGRALAALHARPIPIAEAGAPTPEFELSTELAPVFALETSLCDAFGGCVLRVSRSPTARARPTWSHGDFHADQVALARRDGATILLDLDELRIADPLVDLATWRADTFVEGGAHALSCESLLASYRAAGGQPIDPAALDHATAIELIERGASAIRRLERSAIEKARRCLLLARELFPR